MNLDAMTALCKIESLAELKSSQCAREADTQREYMRRHFSERDLCTSHSCTITKETTRDRKGRMWWFGQAVRGHVCQDHVLGGLGTKFMGYPNMSDIKVKTNIVLYYSSVTVLYHVDVVCPPVWVVPSS